MWCEVAELVKVTHRTNNVGDVTENITKREVFIDEKSISQSEFYQAHAVGLKPSIKLVVKVFDYENERICFYKGERYKILRTYKISSEEIELVLEGDIHVSS